MKQLNKLMRLKLQKLAVSILLSIVIVISSPLYVLAQEAPSAPSAPTASSAPEASQAPEASPAPTFPNWPENSNNPNENSPTNDSSASGNTQNSDTSATSTNNTDGISATNGGNGTNSTNESSVTQADQTNIDLTNTADVANHLDLEAVTGDNSASFNGGSSSVTTTVAQISATVSNKVNSTIVAASGTNCCPSSASVNNSNNASGSTNASTSSASSTNTTNINNDADIGTEIVALALSGGNQTSFNGGDSEIITSDANVVATIITDANAANMGVYQFDVNGNQNGDILLNQDSGNCLNCSDSQTVSSENLANDSNSTNNATASSTNTNSETITNDGDIVNNIEIDAISGQNEASYNGGNSSIKTGDANVVANVIHTLNTVVDGVIYTVNIFGDLVGNILLPEHNAQASSCDNCCGSDVSAINTGNGSGSTNNAEANLDNNSLTTQTNLTTINNNFDLNANSGGNEVNFNAGDNSIVETGDATVDTNVINVANVNVSGKNCGEPVYMVFINDPNDNWQGQIIGATPGTYFYTSSGLLYVVGEDGNLIAVNSGNGAGSTNNAVVNSTNNTNTNQTNTGSITNDINIEANTGDNYANYNHGSSTIKTGNANIFVNVVNFVNSNFSGRKVVLTLVNVFGSWLGHFVPPGFTAPSLAKAPNNPPTGNQGNGAGNQSNHSNNNGSNDNSNSSNSSFSSPKSKTFGKRGSLSSLVGGFRTEKVTEEDNSIALGQKTASNPEISQADDFKLSLRLIAIVISLGILSFLLKKKLFATNSQ